MVIGIVGLGKMGGDIAKKLLYNNHEVIVYDIDNNKVNNFEKIGAVSSKSLNDLVEKINADKKIVWVMVPPGDETKKTINKLSDYLGDKDIVIDGGNSNYKDTINLAKELDKKNINLLDVGTSGGVWGLKEGFSLMIGGSKKAYKDAERIFKDLAQRDGYVYIGESGSGHFVKMIHNGIEYAIMEAYAEGFELLNSKDEFDINLEKVAKAWNNGSVIRSWLLELIEKSLKENPNLKGVKDYVDDSGEGRWTVIESIEQEIPASIIAISLFKRFSSRQENSFSAKMLSVMRNAFGGHEMKKD